MKSPSTLNATQISTPDTYSPVLYTMDYVTQGNCVQLEERNNKQKQHKKSHNQIPMIGGGKRFPTDMFTDEDAIHVSKLPNLIDGQCLYKVHTTHSTWHKQTSDKRYFLMQTSSRSNFSGIWEGGVCQGSWICPNIACPFQQTSYQKQPNCINFQSMRGSRGVKICQICDTLAICKGCGAHKLLRYTQADNIATVYHIGNHVCWVKLENRRVEKKEELFKTYDCAQNLVTGKEMCINKIADYVSKGMEKKKS